MINEGFQQEITKEQALLIQGRLLGIVDRIPEGGFLPRFNETYLSRRALKVVCAEQQTAVGLRENVGSLREWKGAKLQTVEQKDLVKYIRAMEWIPGPPVETKKILVRLARFEPGLTTESA